jgi:hypothetical protein
MGGKAPTRSACSRGTRPRRLLPWVPREKERLELGAPTMVRRGGDAIGRAVPRRRAEASRILGIQDGSPDLGKSRGEGPAWSASMEKKLLRAGGEGLCAWELLQKAGHRVEEWSREWRWLPGSLCALGKNGSAPWLVLGKERSICWLI